MAYEERETGNLIGSDKVEGTAVYGANSQRIGSIERVMIDKVSGKVAYAEFVPRAEIDGLYLVRPYYIVPDGKAGHDAYAVIRETIRSLDQVAIGRVVLTNREHVIALEARDKGLMGMLLRYPYEVRMPPNILTKFRT
jgi:DNA end-binding protein Ku